MPARRGRQSGQRTVTQKPGGIPGSGTTIVASVVTVQVAPPSTRLPTTTAVWTVGPRQLSGSRAANEPSAPISTWIDGIASSSSPGSDARSSTNSVPRESRSPVSVTTLPASSRPE